MGTKIITIDPGLNTAVCTRYGGEKWPHIDFRVNSFKTSSKKSLSGKILDLSDKLAREIQEIINSDIEKYEFYIEGCYSGKSLKSQVALKSGKIFTLSEIIGAYILTIGQILRKNCTICKITPVSWKGNLSDDLIIERIDEMCKEKACKNVHEYCALGMSLSLLNVL